MADCSERARLGLAGHGDAVGEAFQLRDDILGIFGSPEITRAIDFIAQRIASRLAHALTVIDDEHIEPAIRPALADMAAACSQRAA